MWLVLGDSDVEKENFIKTMIPDDQLSKPTSNNDKINPLLLTGKPSEGIICSAFSNSKEGNTAKRKFLNSAEKIKFVFICHMEDVSKFIDMLENECNFIGDGNGEKIQKSIMLVVTGCKKDSNEASTIKELDGQRKKRGENKKPKAAIDAILNKKKICLFHGPETDNQEDVKNINEMLKSIEYVSVRDSSNKESFLDDFKQKIMFYNAYISSDKNSTANKIYQESIDRYVLEHDLEDRVNFEPRLKDLEKVLHFINTNRNTATNNNANKNAKGNERRNSNANNPKTLTPYEDELKQLLTETIFQDNLVFKLGSEDLIFISKNYIKLTDLQEFSSYKTIIVFALKKFFADTIDTNSINKKNRAQMLVFAPEWVLVSENDTTKLIEEKSIFNDYPFPEFVPIDDYVEILKKKMKEKQKENSKKENLKMENFTKLIDNFVEGEMKDMKVGVIWQSDSHAEADILLIRNGQNVPKNQMRGIYPNTDNKHFTLSVSFTEYLIDVEEGFNEAYDQFLFSYMKKVFAEVEKSQICFQYGNEMFRTINKRISDSGSYANLIVYIERIINITNDVTDINIPQPKKHKFQVYVDHVNFLYSLNDLKSDIEDIQIKITLDTYVWYINLNDWFNTLYEIVTKRHTSKIQNYNIMSILRMCEYKGEGKYLSLSEFVNESKKYELGFSNSRKTILIHLLKQFIEEPDQKINNNTLTISGYFIKMSDVKKVLKNNDYKRINHLRIFAFYNLIFDENFEAENLKLTFITSSMTVLNHRTLVIGRNNGKIHDHFFGHSIEEPSHTEGCLEVGLYDDRDESGMLFFYNN